LETREYIETKQIMRTQIETGLNPLETREYIETLQKCDYFNQKRFKSLGNEGIY